MREQSQNPARVCGLVAWLAICTGRQAAAASEPSFDNTARPVLKRGFLGMPRVAAAYRLAVVVAIMKQFVGLQTKPCTEFSRALPVYSAG